LRDDAAIALFAGDTSRAGNAIKQLTAHDGESSDLLLRAQLNIQTGAADLAWEDCEKILKDSRANRREQFQAALTELRISGANKNTDSVWRRIEANAHGTDDVSLDALVVLAQRALSLPGGTSSVPASNATSSVPPTSTGGASSSSPKDKPDDQNLFPPAELSSAIQAHPLVRAVHKLLALDLLERARVALRNELIERAVLQFSRGDPEDVAALARWLNSKGEYHRAIDSIPL